MEYTEFILTVNRSVSDTALEVSTAVCEGGLYVEDYADMEDTVWDIAHVDLIEEDLLQKPRDEVVIHLYVEKSETAAFSEQLRARLLAAGLSEYRLDTKGVKPEDWENSWKQYYHATEIGKRLVVVPSWEDYTKPGRCMLHLDPGMAFGTGTHETTALCLEFLDGSVSGGERVLDIGCGSGILAVAALLLGADSAQGIDIDPIAVRTATENAKRNNVSSRFTVDCGDLAQKANGVYDIVLANIVADAIIRLSPGVPDLLTPNGVFIASGIIDDRQREVTSALEKIGLSVYESHQKNGWVSLICKKTA